MIGRMFQVSDRHYAGNYTWQIGLLVADMGWGDVILRFDFGYGPLDRVCRMEDLNEVCPNV